MRINLEVNAKLKSLSSEEELAFVRKYKEELEALSFGDEEIGKMLLEKLNNK